MRTKTMVIIACAVAVALASYSESISAVFVAVIGAAIFWQGYNIEVKLNKLLDAQHLRLTEDDYNR